MADYGVESVGAELAQLAEYASAGTLEVAQVELFQAKVLGEYRKHLGRRSLTVAAMVAEVCGAGRGQ
jgi:hypothetical protein